MTHDISHEDARRALGDIEVRHRQITEQIDLPGWYWWSISVGWVVLGVINDVGNTVVVSVATFLFGALHAAVAGRVLNARHGSPQLSVRAEVVGRRTPVLLLLCLVVLALETIGLALLARADGADHPVTIASVVVALTILAGGPRLMQALRRRAVEQR